MSREHVVGWSGALAEPTAGLTPAELASSINVSVGTARQVLEDFERDGITAELDGRWRLTEQGRDLARGLLPEDGEDA